MALRALTPRQDDKLGAIVRKVESLVEQRERQHTPPVWYPILVKPKPGTEVWGNRRGECHPVVGTGVSGDELVRDSTAAEIADETDLENNAFGALTLDTATTYSFINCTGGIVTPDDFLVLVRIVVPNSGSSAMPGGAWVAVNNPGHIKFGESITTINAGGSGKASANNETAKAGNGMVVDLSAAHGDESIQQALSIIYVRLNQLRLVIGAECNPAAAAAAPPDYFSISPADNATVVGVDVTLSWGGGAGVDTVHFGQPGNLALVFSGSANSFTPGTLDVDTDYVWTITSTNSEGSTVTSDMLNFQTGPNVSMRTNAWTAGAVVATMTASGGTINATMTAPTANAIATFDASGGTKNGATGWDASAITTMTAVKF